MAQNREIVLTKRNKTVVVVPVYNEAPRVVDVLKKILKHRNIWLVVVDDGSGDKSYQLLKKVFGRNKRVYLLKHSINLGKGAAMKTGVKMAKKIGGTCVVFIDSDGQHNPDKLGKFILLLKKYDLVFGYRDVGKKMPLIRRWGNIIAKNLVKSFFGIVRKDMLCGYFGFNLKVYPKIRWQSPRYGVETEIALRVVINSLCFKEIKIDTIYINKYKGVSIFDAIRILLKLPWWYFDIRK